MFKSRRQNIANRLLDAFHSEPKLPSSVMIGFDNQQNQHNTNKFIRIPSPPTSSSLGKYSCRSFQSSNDSRISLKTSQSQRRGKINWIVNSQQTNQNRNHRLQMVQEVQRFNFLDKFKKGKQDLPYRSNIIPKQPKKEYKKNIVKKISIANLAKRTQQIPECHKLSLKLC